MPQRLHCPQYGLSAHPKPEDGTLVRPEDLPHPQAAPAPQPKPKERPTVTVRKRRRPRQHPATSMVLAFLAALDNGGRKDD